MDDEATSGIERAVFGAVARGDIDAWLRRHLRARLGGDLSHIMFRSGRVAAVYGAALGDGRQVAVKVRRGAADLVYLDAAVACQRRLAMAGYPCPEPLDGPATTDGLTAVIETLRAHGRPGNGHDPSTRRAMAHSLFEQLELLRGVPPDGLVAGAPAWTRYEHGPWPQPHDPMFDFTTTPPAFTWLEELARQAADILNRTGPPDLVGHADWTCGNLRFDNGQVSASYDWDSLAAAPEPVLAGLAAASFTEGSTTGATTPTTAEVTGFLRDYEQARSSPFSDAEQRTSAAAVTWVLAYNARCDLSLLPPGEPPASGSSLHAVTTHGTAYVDLGW